MADEPPDEAEEIEPREPTLSDLVSLCRELNAVGARYVVCGGFAIRAAGYNRHTMDVDLLVEASLENEEKVFQALESLPDRAVRQLDAGDVEKYVVCRVADEILVDLMASTSGITYAEAASGIEKHEVDGVVIPFASPELLWRMKRNTHREKDRPDLLFLRELFSNRGEQPPN